MQLKGPLPRQKTAEDTLVTSLKSVNTIRNTSKPKEEKGEEEEEKKEKGGGGWRRKREEEMGSFFRIYSL